MILLFSHVFVCFVLVFLLIYVLSASAAFVVVMSSLILQFVFLDFFLIFFLIFRKSAIFLHFLPLLRLLSHFNFISIILSDHLSYLVCWGIDISQILLNFPFYSISLYFMYA